LAHLLRNFIALSAISAHVAVSLAPPLAAGEMTRSAYEACQTKDDAGLRSAIESIAGDSLRKSTRTIDYRALVDEQWRRANLDKIIDSRVDIAVEDIKKETTWTERLKSLTDSAVSQKLATDVAERVYRSDTVKVAIEDLAAGVAREVGQSIEIASSDAAAPLLECLKAFIGPRYGNAMAEALAGDAGHGLSVDPSKGVGEASAGAVIKQSTGGIAGATVLIMRRQLGNLAARVGQRIVGSILSRLVTVVAGGVGLVLIAKDIWDFRHGVLPIIATEMKAPATKEKVRDEIATSLSDQMNNHVTEIAAATADHVLNIWQGFKRAHALVLRIAEENTNFRVFIDSVAPSSLPRLDEVVSLVAAAEGESSVLRRLSDGTLNTAVNIMPPAAMTIARDTQSVAAALDWNTVAGNRIDDIVSYDIHRRANPRDFSSASLQRVLALGDQSAVQRLASIPAAARDALLGLDAERLTTLVKTLSENELSSLAGYLRGLQQSPRDRILAAVAENPARMQVLSSAGVRDAIIASTDQSAAAEMMLRPTTSLSPRVFAQDAVLAWEGRINPLLLWYRHPAAVGFSGALAFVVLMWFMRLFRRQTPRTAPPTA